MITSASRDTDLYLNKLDKIRKVKQNYVLISVIGGLSFLHAVNKGMKRLVLIDRDPDACDYASRIILAIKNSENLKQFVDYISSLEYKKNSVIHYKFEERSLEINHFNWLIGFGSFQNNDTFNELREALQQTDLQILNQNIEDSIPDIIQACNIEIPRYVLLSNADSWYYGVKDLSKQLIKTPVAFKMISWETEYVHLPNDHHPDMLNKLKPFVEDRDVQEIPTYLGFAFLKEEFSWKTHEMFSPERVETRKVTPYREDTILYHISNSPELSKSEKINKVKEFISHAYKFKRIIFLNWTRYLTLDETIKIFTDEEFHLLYNISAIQWSGGATGRDRSFFIVWDRFI